MSWKRTQNKDFDALKESLFQDLVVAVLDPEIKFCIVCDASDFSIYCALHEVYMDNHKRVVQYDLAS